MLHTGARLAIVLAALCVFGGAARADGSFSFTGTFSTDDQLQIFMFTLSGSSTVVMQTFSYAGGTNQAGTVIPEGGFAPFLSLFDSSGNLIDEDAAGPSAPLDPVTGNAFDSFLSDSLGPGTYELILSQAGNEPNDNFLADGYTETGNPNFTAFYGCSNGIFCDPSTLNRTGNWAVDIDNVESASAVGAPEPAAIEELCLGLGGLLGLVLLAPRRMAQPSIHQLSAIDSTSHK